MSRSARLSAVSATPRAAQPPPSQTGVRQREPSRLSSVFPLEQPAAVRNITESVDPVRTRTLTVLSFTAHLVAISFF